LILFDAFSPGCERVHTTSLGVLFQYSEGLMKFYFGSEK
jgi:hypothetical protein